MAPFVVREATPGDGDAIAAAHMDSIATLGAEAYAPDVVADWGAPRTGDRYREAMARGVVFFVAIAPPTREEPLLGFSSYAVDGDMHRTAVYVRGSAARQGVGRALFAAVEETARSAWRRDSAVVALLALRKAKR
jgi:GNAT superfamily N-acetyltransferase